MRPGVKRKCGFTTVSKTYSSRLKLSLNINLHFCGGIDLEQHIAVPNYLNMMERILRVAATACHFDGMPSSTIQSWLLGKMECRYGRN